MSAKKIAIDMRLNWMQASKIIAAALQDGTAAGKGAARKELVNMACAADLATEATEALRELLRLKEIKRRIEDRSATPAERADYRANKEAAWQRAARVTLS